MTPIRVTRRRGRAPERWPDPLPLDPRDPDIVRAKKRATRTPGEPASDEPAA